MKAYEVGIRSDGGAYDATIFAPTAGKAKYQRFLALRDAGWNGSFQHLHCRALGDIPVPPTRAQLAQGECDSFNAQFPIGTMLRYWSGVKEGQPTGSAPISHPASVMCDHAVIWLKGVSSCHSISHVEPARESCI